MSYKKFKEWIHSRITDGRWSRETAMTCLELITRIDSLPWYKRYKEWKKYEKRIVGYVIEPINKMIKGE